jgi:hypothetical protein
VEAQPAVYPGIGSRADALKDLRKAVALASDVSYTRYNLAQPLSIDFGKLRSVRKAELEAEIAP